MNSDFLQMPTTKKQKKARKCRGLEILSDVENIDVMLEENHFNGTDREESLDSSLARRPGSATSNNFGNDDENLYQDCRDISSGIDADYGQSSVGSNSHAEINRLSFELNSRISREMDEMMNSVSVQIQRTINDAISNQVLPLIQNAIMAGSGHVTRKGWNVSAEEPEANSEVLRNAGTRDNSRSEHIQIVRMTINPTTMLTTIDICCLHNKTRTSKVGDTSKAQKVQNILFEKNLKFLNFFLLGNVT